MASQRSFWTAYTSHLQR